MALPVSPLQNDGYIFDQSEELLDMPTSLLV
jgi:hypothetical protein